MSEYPMVNWEEKAICLYDNEKCDNWTCLSHAGSPSGGNFYSAGCWSRCNICTRKDERDLPTIGYGDWHSVDEDKIKYYKQNLRYTKDGKTDYVFNWELQSSEQKVNEE